MTPMIKAKTKQDLRENLALALDTLRAHKLRSFLTVLGVVIGVGVIIVVGSLMAGFDQSVQDSISGYGADTAFISQFQQGPRIGRRSAEERMRKPLNADDGAAMVEQCSAVKAVAVSLFPPTNTPAVRYKDQEVVGIDFRGTFPEFVDVYANAAMKQGRFFTAAENEHRTKIAVIGESIAETLFGTLDPIGKEILVDGSTFEVIGVFEKPKAGFDDSGEDRRVAVPYETIKKIYPQAEQIGIRMQAKPGQLDLAVDQVRDLLRRRRAVKYNEPDTFSIQTSQQSIEQFHAIVGMIAVVTLSISGIGLLVGGVGVMNIMLVSVTERTREIGVRKAIGAKRRDITAQFLLEAMTLTGIGGVIGILAASSVAMGIRMITSWSATVPLWAVIVGEVVSIGIGLVFGVWPAMKAARLDPVEALRYE
jgi:ABC-type antimicrobial peptide transport system permease subunit